MNDTKRFLTYVAMFVALGAAILIPPGQGTLLGILRGVAVGSFIILIPIWVRQNEE